MTNLNEAVKKAIRFNHEVIFEHVTDGGEVIYRSCRIDNARRVSKAILSGDKMMVTEHVAKQLEIGV